MVTYHTRFLQESRTSTDTLTTPEWTNNGFEMGAMGEDE